MNRANKLTVDDMDRTGRELANMLGVALRRLDATDRPRPAADKYAHVALVATAAHQAGQPIADAVADHYDLERRAATKLISRARQAGHPIPHDTPGPAQQPLPAPTSLAARTLALGIVPGQAIDKATHDALMAARDRPLTQQPIVRHNKGDGHNAIGDMA